MPLALSGRWLSRQPHEGPGGWRLELSAGLALLRAGQSPASPLFALARRAGLPALLLGWVSGPHRGLTSSASCPCALGKSLFTPKVAAGRAWGGPGLYLLGLPCSSSVGLSPGAAPLPSQLPLPSSPLLPPFYTGPACLRLPPSLTVIPVWLSFSLCPSCFPLPACQPLLCSLALPVSLSVPLCPSLSTSAAPLRHTGDLGTVQAHLS